MISQLGFGASFACRRVNARFCESSGVLVLLFRSPGSWHITDVRSSPPFTATDRCICRADIVCEMGRDPAVIFKFFLRRRFAWYTYHYPDVFVRPVFATALRPYIPGTSRKNAICLHVASSCTIISGFVCRIAKPSGESNRRGAVLA